MEQIEQLKSMREAAQARLNRNPDYKLVNSLESLISDLESTFAPIEDARTVEAEAEESDDETAEEPEPVSGDVFDSFEADAIDSEDMPHALRVVEESIAGFSAGETLSANVSENTEPEAQLLKSGLEEALDDMLAGDLATETEIGLAGTASATADSLDETFAAADYEEAGEDLDSFRARVAGGGSANGSGITSN